MTKNRKSAGAMERDLAPGLRPRGMVHWNLRPAALYEHAVRRDEGRLVRGGPFSTITAPHTGRSPNDKFLVREPTSEGDIWWGSVNQPMHQDCFATLRDDVIRNLSREDELFVRDVHAGADPRYRMSVRFITTNAWHAMFVYNMFIRPESDDPITEPRFTVLHVPDMRAEPGRHCTRSGTFIAINFAERIALIGGTQYAGEMKKTMFSVLNYMYPNQGILPMHCSANVGLDGDVAIFFGLSGTGKTTLSADSDRGLIGDDEHGWSNDGVFNFEGGCYAKIIRLSQEGEPEIHATTEMFGTILENVVVDPETRFTMLDDDSITENTRASYPIYFIKNHVPQGMAGHPRNVVFLTADAFGVLPPIAKLTSEQAMYHFLSGYTAKVAGTEKGITEPQATFSACFGAPFLPMHPGVYAKMLGERIARHNVQCWLVNTGWTGGPYGEGNRINLPYTRAMVSALLNGSLNKAPTRPDPIFGIHTVTEIPALPSKILDPRSTWADPDKYDVQARKLAEMFDQSFKRYADGVPEAVRGAGPIT
jgi:phosphoenolpyruvate carboxykinase (ATP)